MGRKEDNINLDLHYGNWCGPGWTAGQFKDSADITAEDFNVPAVDALDQACKNHDIGLSLATTPEEVQKVHARFNKEARAAGILGTAFAFLVDRFGPTEPGMSFYNLLCRKQDEKLTMIIITVGHNLHPIWILP